MASIVAGAFPISCQVMIQCEPNVFDNEALRAAQRSVPLAIVHGKNDPNIEFASGGQYAADLFGENGWPSVHLFTSETAGHKFMLFPVGEASRWLEVMASQEPKVLIDFAENQAKAGHYRDAIAALRKVKMGVCMTAIGVMMSLSAFNRLHGEKRGWSR